MRLPLSISISLTLLSAVLLGGGKAYALEKTDTAALYFHQGHSDFDYEYHLNGGSIDKAVGKISEIMEDSLLRFHGLRISGAASPEGSVAINRRLSHQRAERLIDCIGAYYEIPDSLTSFEFKGRDWEGLRRLVADDMNVPDRAEVLATIDEIIAATPEGEERDHSGNLARLKKVGTGEAYAYMYKNLFPRLRKSEVLIDYWMGMPVYNGLPQVGKAELPGLPTMIGGLTPERVRKPFYMSLKTNLLYDLAAIPAIGAEFYLGKNLSLAANWEYGWWDTDRLHRYWRAYGGDLGLRWWFGRAAHDKPLTGHHVGIYGGVVTYDFEWGGTGYMGGKPGHTLWDRCMKIAGLEYGYSLPIARRLNLDFTIGIGYMGGKYVKYHPEGKWYVWDSTHQLHWFGPTKAEISLVWLIGYGNENRKGGRR